MGKECRFHRGKSQVLNALHKEVDLGTLISPSVVMVHQFVNGSTLFFVGDDIFVKFPVAALPSLKGHPSKFVLNLSALGVDGLFPKQLCVEGLVGGTAVL